MNTLAVKTGEGAGANARTAATAVPYAAKVGAPFAVLGLRSNGHALTELTYLPAGEAEFPAVDAIAELAARELARYFADPDYRFTVPLAPEGTAFRRRVWNALSAIPRGDTRTYGDLARALGSVPRAVGQACGANPIALIIPSHRVVGANGALGGFMHASAGAPVAIKRWLLVHEGHRSGA